MTVVVYWTLCHAETIESSEYKNHENRILHTYFVHIVPAVFFGANFLISHVQMVPSHALIFFPITSVYAFLNFRESIAKGEALYGFLDWPNNFWGAFMNYLVI